MFIARMKDKYMSDHDAICNLYDDNEISIFHSKTFSPWIEYTILPLHIHGKTYAERKNAARDLAIEYQTMTNCGGLSYLELSTIQSYFETIAARYGLIREYRENGII